MSRKRPPSDPQLSLFQPQLSSQPTACHDLLPQRVAVYRVALVRESSLPLCERTLRSSTDSADLIRRRLVDVDREHFVVLLLDRKNKVIGINTVSIGSLTASVVSPREVFKPAILANAAAIICGHNHPSGDPRPSDEDRRLTRRLVEGGRLLDIQILDHIIVGDGTSNYFSFADNGTL